MKYYKIDGEDDEPGKLLVEARMIYGAKRDCIVDCLKFDECEDSLIVESLRFTVYLRIYMCDLWF